MTILEAARKAGVVIPTLCHHEKLQPFGACRLCIVEVGDARKLVASCVSPVAEGQVVTTRSERIDRFRRTLLELQLSHAPHSPQLQELAREYGADASRFEPEASGPSEILRTKASTPMSRPWRSRSGPPESPSTSPRSVRKSSSDTYTMEPAERPANRP